MPLDQTIQRRRERAADRRSGPTGTNPESICFGDCRIEFCRSCRRSREGGTSAHGNGGLPTKKMVNKQHAKSKCRHELTLEFSTVRFACSDNPVAAHLAACTGFSWGNPT